MIFRRPSGRKGEFGCPCSEVRHQAHDRGARRTSYDESAGFDRLLKDRDHLHLPRFEMLDIMPLLCARSSVARSEFKIIFRDREISSRRLQGTDKLGRVDII